MNVIYDQVDKLWREFANRCLSRLAILDTQFECGDEGFALDVYLQARSELLRFDRSGPR